MSLMHLLLLEPSTHVLSQRAKPFQLAANIRHQVSFDRNAALSRIWRWGCLAILSSTITCLRKVLPGATTVHTCWRTPMSDSNSHLMHDFLCFNSSGTVIALACHLAGKVLDKWYQWCCQEIQLWCLGQLVFRCQWYAKFFTEYANSSYTAQS